MNWRLLLTLVVALTFVFACKEENISNEMQSVSQVKDKYKSAPNPENLTKYLAAVNEYCRSNKNSSCKEMFDEGKKMAIDQKQLNVVAGIDNEILKLFPNDPDRFKRLVDLSNTLELLNNKSASNALRFFLTKVDKVKADAAGFVQLVSWPSTSEEFLNQAAEKIFVEPDFNGLNKNASYTYVDIAEAYALANPKAEDTPSVLYKASEISKSLGTYKKTIKIYDWILSSYPNAKVTPVVQFLKAFTLEEKFNNIEAAKASYELFLEKFPDHHFADDARFSLKNLGKSDAELQAEIEKLQSNTQNKSN